MKVLIVDDEAKSRSMLKRMCETYCENLEIIGLADSVIQAQENIAIHQPDLVFLDIHMPVQSGFALMDAYQNSPAPFSVIFTTAYDQYALDAFKSSAVDYLLKPIEIERLRAAVKEVQRRRYGNESVQGSNPLKIDKIALPTSDGLNFVKLQNIIRCEAEEGYTHFFYECGRKQLITKTLKYYENLLVSKGFCRVHKSHLVNLSHVKKFLKTNPMSLEMTDSSKVEISSLKREELLKKLTPN